MKTVIVIALLVLILGSAAWYIRKEKKRGKACIGCPCAGACGQCSCGSTEE